MFLTSSPTSALSDDIGKTGSVSQKTSVFSLALWLWPAVNSRALTGCARDNNPVRGTLSIIGVVQLQ